MRLGLFLLLLPLLLPLLPSLMLLVEVFGQKSYSVQTCVFRGTPEYTDMDFCSLIHVNGTNFV